MPEISVLMGVLCGKKKLSSLKGSVQSILNQSFQDFEFLICDDGSDDAVFSYLDYIEKKDSRVRIIREGTLCTLSEKLNACFAQSQGEYIARMDDDDFSHLHRLKKQLAYLKEHPDISFAGCNVRLIKNKELSGKRDFPEFPTVRDFYFVQPFIHPSLIFRRKALDAVEGYSENPSCFLCEDYDLLLRLYAKGYKGANLQQYLFDYTTPSTAKGNRKMAHRWNESITRYHRFRELKVFPSALPYVFKPLIVGLLPENVLKCLKEHKL